MLTIRAWHRCTNMTGARRAAMRPGMRLGCVALAGFLGACSSVPDELNPVEWYKTAEGYLFDKEGEAPPPAAKTAQTAQPLPGENEPYPKLASVPGKPQPQETVAQREAMASGLVADREQARYLDQQARKPAPPETVTASRPAPQPLPPTMPVSTPSQQPQPKQAPAAPVATATAAVPPAPPAVLPQPAQQAPPESEQASQPSTGAQVTDVYMRQLQASQLTTTTAPVGPTADGTAGAAVAGAGQQLAAVAGTAAPSPQRPAQGISAQVAAIAFANGSASLTDKARAELRKVAKMHKELGGRVRVIGHASSRTKDLDISQHLLVNYDISVKRADAVARALRKYGVNPINMDVSARSDTEPVYYEVMPRGEAHNRRTEIYLDY